MPSYNDRFYLLRKEIAQVYEEQEATAIAQELMEYVTGKTRLQRIMEKDNLLTSGQEEQIQHSLQRIVAGEPLQYVTGIQWFLGRPFKVNRHVLIPRPETEELVQWIADEWKGRDVTRILEIGTGSGCIAISLKLLLPGALVTSLDVSQNAIELADENATALGATIGLVVSNFLDEATWTTLGTFDVIVSNPPYIPLSYKDALDRNVRDYEPETALFVPEDDALLFYRKIGLFANSHLSAEGSIYCEVHADHAKETKALFEGLHYAHVILRKDMHGKDRMIKATSSGLAK